jgi:hypothetical protein
MLVVAAGWAKFAVAVVGSDRPLPALEVQPLVEACPRRGVIGWSWMADLTDTADIPVHVVMDDIFWCPTIGWCRRPGGRAAAAVRGVSAAVLYRRVVARRASSSNRPAGLADTPVPPGSGRMVSSTAVEIGDRPRASFPDGLVLRRGWISHALASFYWRWRSFLLRRSRRCDLRVGFLSGLRSGFLVFLGVQ